MRMTDQSQAFYRPIKKCYRSIDEPTRSRKSNNRKEWEKPWKTPT